MGEKRYRENAMAERKNAIRCTTGNENEQKERGRERREKRDERMRRAAMRGGWTAVVCKPGRDDHCGEAGLDDVDEWMHVLGDRAEHAAMCSEYSCLLGFFSILGILGALGIRGRAPVITPFSISTAGCRALVLKVTGLGTLARHVTSHGLSLQSTADHKNIRSTYGGRIKYRSQCEWTTRAPGALSHSLGLSVGRLGT